MQLLYDPSISLLGIYPEETLIKKDTCTVCHSQDMEAT